MCSSAEKFIEIGAGLRRRGPGPASALGRREKRGIRLVPVAAVSAFFIDHVFFNRFGAVVAGSGLVKSAIEADVEILAALLAGLAESRYEHMSV
jgi:hypothetical protein